MYQATTATTKLNQLSKRIRGVAGGTSASKTISILLLLINYAQTHHNELISVVSESFPHLKRGSIRDFLNIMEQHNYFKESRWNKTDYTYTFETDTKLEFFSADQPGKVRGPRRQVLFVNEANNIPYETFTQLEVRTSKVIWLDWNPINEFWWYSEILPSMDVDFITLTYKDNEALEPSIIEAIEARKGNKQWWLVYGLGQLGEVEGKIYKDWQLIDEIPHEARLERYGLDFGYSNDPTSIVALYYYNGGFILDEITYRKGLSNKQIADTLLNVPQCHLGIFLYHATCPYSFIISPLYVLSVSTSISAINALLMRLPLASSIKLELEFLIASYSPPLILCVPLLLIITRYRLFSIGTVSIRLGNFVLVCISFFIMIFFNNL